MQTPLNHITLVRCTHASHATYTARSVRAIYASRAIHASYAFYNHLELPHSPPRPPHSQVLRPIAGRYSPFLSQALPMPAVASLPTTSAAPSIVEAYSRGTLPSKPPCWPLRWRSTMPPRAALNPICYLMCSMGSSRFSRASCSTEWRISYNCR